MRDNTCKVSKTDRAADTRNEVCRGCWKYSYDLYQKCLKEKRERKNS